MCKILSIFFLLPLFATAQPVFPPATQAEVNAGVLRSKFVSPATLDGWNGSGSGISNVVANMTTNIPVFGAVYGTGAAGTNGQPYTLIWPVHGVNTNVSTNATAITVQKDGFYQVGVVVSFKATNDDTFFLSVLTNGVEHTGLRSYVDYQGANAGAALATNFVSSMGIVYALSNTAFTVQLNWHLAAAQALTNLNRAFFVNKINTPSGGGSGGGSGTTETQWIPVAAQFATNSSGEFVVKNGAVFTNISVRAGLALPTLTASRVTFVNASGSLTNVTSASASTDFVHADGSVGVPTAAAAGNNFEIQYNEGAALSASTNITVVTNKSAPQIIVGTPAMSSTVGGFEVRGVNNTNQVTQHGMSATDSTLNVGVSNGVYVVQFGITGGRLSLTPSAAGGLGSQISGAWSYIEATNFFGVASFHTPGTVTANQFSTTNETPGSVTAGIDVYATNLTQKHRIQGAHQMSVLVTNIVGLLHKAFASVIEYDASQIHNVIVTNRVTGVSSIIMTNLAEGQLLSLDVFGEASGGSSRVITLIPNTGYLALDGNNPGTGPALNLAFTLTNGNKAEISGKVRKVFGATNIIEYLVNQSKF